MTPKYTSAVYHPVGDTSMIQVETSKPQDIAAHFLATFAHVIRYRPPDKSADALYAWSTRANRYVSFDDVAEDTLTLFCNRCYHETTVTQGGEPMTVLRPVYKGQTNSTLVREVIRQIRAQATQVRAQAPCSIVEGVPFDPRTDVQVANGILSLATKELRPKSRDVFSLTECPVPYVADAEEPTLWLDFLKGAFNGDADSIELIRSFLVSLLPAVITHPISLMGVGRSKSGKGTIKDIYTAILGPEQIGSIDMLQLSGDIHATAAFGDPFVKLVIVDEPEDGQQIDSRRVAAVIKQITGGSHVALREMHKRARAVQMDKHVLLIANDIPQLLDESGAIVQRFRFFRTMHSHADNPDTTLRARFAEMLPSIFRWFVDGWATYQARRLVQPDAAGLILDAIEEASSPLAQFIAECCHLHPDAHVAKDDLYYAYEQWCITKGITKPLSRNGFKRKIPTVADGVDLARPWGKDAEGKRPRHYSGIGLRAGKGPRRQQPPPGSPDVSGQPDSGEGGWVIPFPGRSPRS